MTKILTFVQMLFFNSEKFRDWHAYSKLQLNFHPRKSRIVQLPESFLFYRLKNLKNSPTKNNTYERTYNFWHSAASCLEDVSKSVFFFYKYLKFFYNTMVNRTYDNANDTKIQIKTTDKMLYKITTQLWIAFNDEYIKRNKSNKN